jgi:hypothetical protein
MSRVQNSEPIRDERFGGRMAPGADTWMVPPGIPDAARVRARDPEWALDV